MGFLSQAKAWAELPTAREQAEDSRELVPSVPGPPADIAHHSTAWHGTVQHYHRITGSLWLEETFKIIQSNS